MRRLCIYREKASIEEVLANNKLIKSHFARFGLTAAVRTLCGDRHKKNRSRFIRTTEAMFILSRSRKRKRRTQIIQQIYIYIYISIYLNGHEFYGYCVINSNSTLELSSLPHSWKMMRISTDEWMNHPTQQLLAHLLQWRKFCATAKYQRNSELLRRIYDATVLV